MGQREVHKIHALGVGGSIPPVALFLYLKIFAKSFGKANEEHVILVGAFRTALCSYSENGSVQAWLSVGWVQRCEWRVCELTNLSLSFFRTV